MAKRPRLPAGHNTLDQILFDQGFGERRVCEGLILNGLVQVNGEVVDDLDAAIAHIRAYSSDHTEVIATEDAGNAERFVNALPF